MRKYTSEKYIEFSEKTSDLILKNYMDKELQIIKNVKNAKEKIFIDLGAGHGRITPVLSRISKNVISIEINSKMLPELKRRASKFNNVKIIEGDITKLSEILKNEYIQKPVLLLLQNTLGVLEGNNWKKVLEEMKKVAKENKGEIIISFNRAEALKDWGIKKVYPSMIEMVGEPDLEKTDFKKGLFVSKTGYTSKWRNKAEIEEIKKFLDGKIINEVLTDNFCIIYLQYY